MNDVYDLNDHIYRLLITEPFFAHLSRMITKMPTKAIPTAGVRVNPETAQFEMIYNPDFFDKLPENHVRGVLIHEFYHLVFGHVTDRLPESVNPKIWNIATDLAINSLIGKDNLPSFVCFPGSTNFENYPEGCAAEYYLEMLKEDPKFNNAQQGQQQQGDDGSGQGGQNGQFDSHDEWGDNGNGDNGEQQGEGSGSGSANEIASERLKDMMQKAANDCGQKNSWGSVSSQVREDIMKRLKTKVDWKKVLRYFIGRAQRSDRTNTIRKINKRFPYIHAGRKTNYSANIAIAIDQSGSVGDEMLNEFFNELNKLATLATFTVIPFDDRVMEKDIVTWRKGDTNKKMYRIAAGGTNFQSVTDYVNKHPEYDAVLFLTDLYAPVPGPCKIQRAWMTTEYCKQNAGFNTNELVLTV
jgi:predicted metal-dependent peptidase